MTSAVRQWLGSRPHHGWELAAPAIGERHAGGGGWKRAGD
jgi:hypothetical protein